MIVYRNYDLSGITRWKVGGTVSYYITVDNIVELRRAIVFAEVESLNYLVVGNTTNLLFSSNRIEGVLIRLVGEFSSIYFNGESCTAGASVFVPKLALNCARRGLSGIEHTVGIPASLGGLIVMNGGSQRKSISERIVSVRSVTGDGQVVERLVEDFDFSYRESIYKYNSEIVISCDLKLQKSTVAEVRSEMLAILRSRRKKFPLKQPNCGSVFKSSPELYASYGPPGFVIESCGLKGLVNGRAQISEFHANFIVNLGGSTDQDILELISLCQKRVRDKTGIEMIPEVRYVNEDLTISNL